jgi:hypothetical protein
MPTTITQSSSDMVRQHAVENYLTPARRRRETSVSVNVGVVHRALRLGNRVPLVCTALEAQKFLRENGIRLVSKTGPPSGQSTTVTYTYEFLEQRDPSDRRSALERLRGALKDVYAEYGGGEAYLRAERASFRDPSNPE